MKLDKFRDSCISVGLCAAFSVIAFLVCWDLPERLLGEGISWRLNALDIVHSLDDQGLLRDPLVWLGATAFNFITFYPATWIAARFWARQWVLAATVPALFWAAFLVSTHWSEILRSSVATAFRMLILIHMIEALTFALLGSWQGRRRRIIRTTEGHTTTELRGK